MFISKIKYESLRKRNLDLIEENKKLQAMILESKSNQHKTTPLCKGCVNCIETGVGYFSHGLEFKEYECMLNQTCKDFKKA